MDMNNLRTESHVAQKIRRHKLRFQQNSDDPTHQQLPQDPNFEAPRPRYGPVSYDPNVFPQEMLNSIAMLQQPNHGFVDQESCSGSGSRSGIGTGSGQGNLQTGGNEWSVVAPMNIDQSYNNNNNEDLQNGLQNIQVFGCTPFYQNTLQEVVTSATVGSHVDQSKNVLEMNQSIPCWMNGSDQLGFVGNRNNNNNNDHGTIENSHITQGLSLSLSSVPQAKTEYPNLHSGLKPLKVENVTISDPKQLVGVSCFRSMGPLGPFTGYATILKNSKYLEPAQELLSDSCDVGGAHELVQTCDTTHKILEEEMSRVSGESGASSSTIYGASEHVTCRSSALSESYLPEFHHKKAKLIYMQDEVCRRYKQYHQQMQMVISSFETVAGLATATPYVSLALKSVSRHFHFVKNAISEQLTQMKKTFDDLCSPSKTFDANNATDSLRSMEHSLQRHGKSSSGTGFLGNQQPVWRPQRGLPERAVSVLKAWLFDHFLHPYPSDADKHMLATQTGLTRNQVSNWFINARVRIWKPMVEEIHTLETKGLATSSSNKPLADGQDTSRVDMGSMTNKQQPESSRTSGALTVTNGQNEPNEQLWNQEKRARPDYQIPQATMDRSFTNMMPYPRAAFEAGGVGPVSLTLGLWQNAEHVQQLQQHEHQFRQHFGGHLIHDFVG
ncbi:putative transcription factor Homeodomain-TALE-BEL family [Helianthus annuus]|nr:putative transcription factor Homeodomain-TALE-BEL family [Helianthus annuus]